MSTKHNTPLRTLSLFSGAGGMDVGLEAAGFENVLALELDRLAQHALRLNRPRWQVPRDGDVLSAAKTITPADLGLAVGELDLVNGGPPCQPFSNAAQWTTSGRRGMEDVRAGTVHALLDVTASFLPRAVLLENVPGFVSGPNSALPEIERRLQAIRRTTGHEYVVHYRVLNAADYGVAQNRKRVIVLMLRDGGEFEWPEPTHADTPLRSWDVLADVEESEPPELRGKWAGLLASIPPGHNYQWLTSEGGGPELFGYRTKYWNFLLKLDPARPSWTLAASPGPSTGPFHWDNRPLSSREMMRLQSFPDGWLLPGDQRAQTKLVGNATPALLAELLGRKLRKHLTGIAPADGPMLLRPRLHSAPPRSVVATLPDQYASLIGAKDRHAGAGQGPAPRVKLDSAGPA